jgi:hypothetical protein
METSAPKTGLLWLSITSPDIETVTPGVYRGLSVETVMDRPDCDATGDTRINMPRIRGRTGLDEIDNQLIFVQRLRLKAGC